MRVPGQQEQGATKIISNFLRLPSAFPRGQGTKTSQVKKLRTKQAEQVRIFTGWCLEKRTEKNAAEGI